MSSEGDAKVRGEGKTRRCISCINSLPFKFGTQGKEVMYCLHPTADVVRADGVYSLTCGQMRSPSMPCGSQGDLWLPEPTPPSELVVPPKKPREGRFPVYGVPPGGSPSKKPVKDSTGHAYMKTRKIYTAP